MIKKSLKKKRSLDFKIFINFSFCYNQSLGHIESWMTCTFLIKGKVHPKISLLHPKNMWMCGRRVEFKDCGQHLLPTATTQTHTSRCYPHTPQGKKGTEIRPINIPANSVTAGYLSSGLQTKCLKNTPQLKHSTLTQSKQDLVSMNKE